MYEVYEDSIISKKAQRNVLNFSHFVVYISFVRQSEILDFVVATILLVMLLNSSVAAKKM